MWTLEAFHVQQKRSISEDSKNSNVPNSELRGMDSMFSWVCALADQGRVETQQEQTFQY